MATLVAVGPPPAANAAGCGPRYVAAGDDVPAGNEVSTDQRYPDHLLKDHLSTWGSWCLYNTGSNSTTSSSYISGGQFATDKNYLPDLITLTVGQQNSGIVDVINSCFDKVKSHDFTGANACAAVAYGNSTRYSSLTNNLVTILSGYKTVMAGRPRLVVAVTGYANPYPGAIAAIPDVALLCLPLIDTATTCTTRWAQFPPALITLAAVVKKVNSTIASAVAPFATGSQGRFVFVNPYDKLSSHCMQMDVSIKTAVDHGTFADEHDSDQDLGCSSPWWVKGSAGTDIPEYLQPAVDGVLTAYTQTTTGMGVHLTDDGQKCVSDLVWEAVKTKLGVPEAPASSVC